MRKRGLVLSGGGALGAYEVGVLKNLIIYRGKEYDFVSGVSVGALNALNFAQSTKGLQADSVKNLEEIWLGIETKDVYKDHAWWVFNYLWSFWKKSLHTMKPLEEVILENLDYEKFKASPVNIRVGLVHLQTGHYFAVDLKNKRLSKENIAKIVHASCVFPGLFEPVHLTGIPGFPEGDYVDGGIRDTIPLRAITSAALKEITDIDVVITSPIGGGVPYQKKFSSAIDVGLRAAFIMSDEVMITDRLQGLCNINPGIKVRVFAPNRPLDVDGFKFNAETARNLIKKGYDETNRKIVDGTVPIFHSH